MSSRQPKRITNESPHQKLDPREVKNKATARRNEQYSDHEIYHDDFEIEEFVTYTDIYDDVRNLIYSSFQIQDPEYRDACDHRKCAPGTLADRFYFPAEMV